MSISHGAATRTALCNTAVDLLDAGASFGTLKFLNASDQVLATVTLQKPAFSAASGPTATLLMSGSLTSGPCVAGTISKFWMQDSNALAGTTIAGTVGTSGADINLSSVVVGNGDLIRVDAISYTAAT